jgi:ribosome modulation factor
MTKFWHTFVEGYRANLLGIDRLMNWYEPVRPNTRDSEQWFDGWDKAQKDRGIK